MGLDMNLYLEHTIYESKYRDENLTYPKEITYYIPYDDYGIERVTTYEVAYWRKANAIHNWITNCVGQTEINCEKIYLTIEQLEQLVSDCKEALNAEYPDEFLPTTSGFFFGSTEYGEYYYSTVRETITMVEPVIEFLKAHSEDDEWKVYYQAWW